jgi:predicted ATPase/DNA-binding SARP family transcriptional activator
VTRLRTRKVGAVLAYLALRGGAGSVPAPRERVCASLWPDADEASARHNLSNALTVLRQALEPPGVAPGSVIEADRHGVRLRPDSFTCDATEFERGATAALALPPGAAGRALALADACALYTGPLLTGVSDEEWASEEAARLSALFLRASVSGASGLLDAGDAAGALSLASRAAADDPLSEEAIALVMRAHLEMGEPSAAHSAFRRHERRLRAEAVGGEEPSAELRKLAREARRAGGVPASASRGQAEGQRPAAAGHVGLRDMPADAAALAAVSATRFFGREAEMGRLVEMLSAPRTRLVTITGAGGTGKTRLALETAAAATAAGGGEAGAGAAPLAVFVPLADLTAGAQVPGALLRALGIPPEPGRGSREQAAAVLSGGPPGRLLILDNFEQLVDAGGPEELAALLAATPPHVRLLVTSRARLRVTGEREFRLAPLPTTGGTTDLEALAALPAVALFVDRSQMARHDFGLTEQNAPDVAALVDRLEGVPLALELAAARTAVFMPAQILSQLDARPLDALASRRRDVAPRHASLRATLRWSCDLLPPGARDFLADVSVFRGGWTLEATAAVSPEADALEMLTVLRDASLVSVSDDEDGIRFSLLETVRQFAAETLGGRGDAADSVRERHLSWCMALAEEARPQLTGPEQGAWLRRLDAEHDNLRAALSWGCAAAASPDSAAACLRIAGALGLFWVRRGHSTEGLGTRGARAGAGRSAERRPRPCHGRKRPRDGAGRGGGAFARPDRARPLPRLLRRGPVPV